MGLEQFVGVWELASAVYWYADGREAPYLGEQPMGQLMYDAAGNMSVHLMRTDRPKFLKEGRLEGTTDEIKQAFEGYHGYFGTYRVDEDAQTVTHYLQGCSFPNWVGSEQRRGYTLDGEQLTLRTPPIQLREMPAVGTLVWRRIRSH